MCLKEKVIEDLCREKFENCGSTEDQFVFLDTLRTAGMHTVADDLESSMPPHGERMLSVLEMIREQSGLPV